MLCSLKFPPLEKGEKHTKTRVPRDKKKVKKHRPYWERQLHVLAQGSLIRVLTVAPSFLNPTMTQVDTTDEMKGLIPKIPGP